jgi:hypothetical protein
MLKRIAITAGFLLAAVAGAHAMNFALQRAQSTVHASGPIEEGDAAKFAALPKFDTLELDSPGGLVGEALAIAANMDARGGIRTVVKPGASCASACAMALFVSGKTRVVFMGGRIGIHSAAYPDGTQAPEYNEAVARNATNHGVPWSVIEGFGNYTKPSSMMWLGAEEAECWGLMRWNSSDTSNDGIACFAWTLQTKNVLPNIKHRPGEVTAESANDLLCRMNAGTSRLFVSTGRDGQGFSDAYRRGCEHIAADPKTPKYAAIDIIMWLTLTDPNIWTLKPAALLIYILDGDESQIDNCWKCFTIFAMSKLTNGHPKEAVQDFQRAANVVKRDIGSVPEWLTSRLEIAEAEAAKQNH